MSAQISKKAPNLKVSEWVQGNDTNLDQHSGNVVLVEVFQVNCPGCFMYGIPEAIEIFNKYKSKGVSVLGVATAFEDFDKNTLKNLKLLVETGKVVGETEKMLSQYGQLDGDKITFKIPYPIAMDSLIKQSDDVTKEQMDSLIKKQIPDFDSQSENYKNEIYGRVKNYFLSKEYSAETFEMYALPGTPSSILIDRKGILRDISFGQNGSLESKIQNLLNE
ncbi:MAG TPA: redoxin domain-containing protein [Candidatus Nitrosopelagicus sp.]|jgi:thiol-disulfide isomerase/thioredoxin|nr:redoxin domain-containing protein [Marine Group I thaumarchaeote]HIA09686.1 redoxin domain-containing protein [Candidatus Nitrosopelagicus sp.]HIC05952.1 redoxin domain-containing protein [Candidatus Nitrosopelagicus sp.]